MAGKLRLAEGRDSLRRAHVCPREAVPFEQRRCLLGEAVAQAMQSSW